MNQQDHQYLVKSKYGSLPNKNRTSSLIYDDEPIITEYIEEIFEPSMIEPQVILPSFIHGDKGNATPHGPCTIHADIVSYALGCFF